MFGLRIYGDRMTNLNWSFSQVWNESFENREERSLAPRTHIWASELGGAFIDRYLKMKAIPVTNPPNPRSLRKFEAGILFEWIVGLILKRAGILIEAQEWAKYQYPDLVEVTGKIDYMAGGKPVDKLFSEGLGLPERFSKATDAIIKHFQEKYPEGLKETVLEIKSCSAFTFDSYEKGNAEPKHVLQAFHYLKAKNMSEAHIIYISRDDLRICEVGVFNCPDTEKLYKDDIEKMTHYIKTNTEPEKENEILFTGTRFSQNWKVAYSNYLTKLYGYKSQMEYEEKYKNQIASWNRTLGRVVNGDRMTELNLKTIAEIKKVFPNLDNLVKKAKENKIGGE